MRDNLIDTSSDCDSAKLVPVRRKDISDHPAYSWVVFLYLFSGVRQRPGPVGPHPAGPASALAQKGRKHEFLQDRRRDRIHGQTPASHRWHDAADERKRLQIHGAGYV